MLSTRTRMDISPSPSVRIAKTMKEMGSEGKQRTYRLVKQLISVGFLVSASRMTFSQTTKPTATGCCLMVFSSPSHFTRPRNEPQSDWYGSPSRIQRRQARSLPPQGVQTEQRRGH